MAPDSLPWTLLAGIVGIVVVVAGNALLIGMCLRDRYCVTYELNVEEDDDGGSSSHASASTDASCSFPTSPTRLISGHDDRGRHKATL